MAKLFVSGGDLTVVNYLTIPTSDDSSWLCATHAGKRTLLRLSLSECHQSADGTMYCGQWTPQNLA